MMKKVCGLLLTLILVLSFASIMVGATGITYDNVLYYEDFQDYEILTGADLTDTDKRTASLAQAGLTPSPASAANSWQFGVDDEGRKCLVGTGVADSYPRLYFGDSMSGEYSLEITFKIVPTETNSCRVGLLYMYDVTTESFTYKDKYLRTNFSSTGIEAFYKVPKNDHANAVSQSTVTNSTASQAQIAPNVIQKVKVDVTLRTGGVYIDQRYSVGQYNSSTGNFDMNFITNKGVGTSSFKAAYLYGQAGFEFLNGSVSGNKYYVYEIKVVDNKLNVNTPNANRTITTDIDYKNDQGEPILEGTPFPTNADITIAGDFGIYSNIERTDTLTTTITPYTDTSITYKPVVISAVYDGDTLFDVGVFKLDGNMGGKSINGTLKTPSDTANTRIKSFFWTKSGLIPISEPFVPKTE